MVPVFIGHTQGYMLLDTGSTITVLDELFFSKSFPDILYIDGKVDVITAGGKHNDWRFVNKMNIRVGHIGGPLSYVAVGNLQDIIPNGDKCHAVGILGMDFIHAFCNRIDLDIKRELLTLYVAK
jgi:hypothetical protein